MQHGAYCPLHGERWKLQNEEGTKAEILPKEKEVSEFHAEQAEEFPSCERKGNLESHQFLLQLRGLK